jgi:predicted short-subunit dehydrogenase-like oxidoreductase (DUF2520 family)
MLPGMAAKPCIAIVGAGNLGTALAVSLVRVGYPIEGIVARNSAKSSVRAKKLAKEINAPLLFDLEGVGANLVWFCVPDSEIARAAASVAARFRAKGKIALHSSGALTSDELNPLRKKGAAVASVHPLMTFVRGSRSPLAGVSFAIEGDPKAVRVAREIVKDLGGHAYAIRKKDKPAYHAWGAFTSPLFTALLATSEQVAMLAGVKQKEARARSIPILLQTLANYASLGAAGAFSGPVIRGDVDTIRRHLEALHDLPVARDAYAALVGAALKYLPAKNKGAIKKLLDSSR